MKRTRMNPRKDRKVFRKTSGQHSGNQPTVRSVMRGGIRK